MSEFVENSNSAETDHTTVSEPKNTMYPLMEDFYTIQGEGAYSGKAAYFIRLAGCDVGCWWCDVKESWDREKYPEVSAEAIVARAKKSGAGIAVITGGEPLLYNLDALIICLRKEGMKVHIETSGSSTLTGRPDWITLSPKRFKKPLNDIYARTDELKVVVLTGKDLKWAEENAKKCPEHTRFFLQPEWDTPSSVDLIINYVKENPQWQISLQTHKFLNIP